MKNLKNLQELKNNEKLVRDLPIISVVNKVKSNKKNLAFEKKGLTLSTIQDNVTLLKMRVQAKSGVRQQQ